MRRGAFLAAVGTAAATHVGWLRIAFLLAVYKPSFVTLGWDGMGFYWDEDARSPTLLHGLNHNSVRPFTSDRQTAHAQTP